MNTVAKYESSGCGCTALTSSTVLLVDGSEDKTRVGDRAPGSGLGYRWYGLKEWGGGGINRFSKKYVILNPVHLSMFEAYHGK